MSCDRTAWPRIAAPEYPESGGYRRPMRCWVEAGDDPREQTPREEEVQVHQEVQRRAVCRRHVERGEVQQRETAEIQGQRDDRVRYHVHRPRAQDMADGTAVRRRHRAQHQRHRGTEYQRQWRVHAEKQVLVHVAAEVAVRVGQQCGDHGENEEPDADEEAHRAPRVPSPRLMPAAFRRNDIRGCHHDEDHDRSETTAAVMGVVREHHRDRRALRCMSQPPAMRRTPRARKPRSHHS